MRITSRLRYQRVGGIQTAGYELGTDTVDITSQDDASRWRQLLANAGVKSMSASGNGVFKDDADARAAAVEPLIRGQLQDRPRLWHRCACHVSPGAEEFSVVEGGGAGAGEGEAEADRGYAAGDRR